MKMAKDRHDNTGSCTPPVFEVLREDVVSGKGCLALASSRLTALVKAVDGNKPPDDLKMQLETADAYVNEVWEWLESLEES